MTALAVVDATAGTTLRSPPIGPALLDDAARVLHQLGLKSVRAAVVDLPSSTFHPGWSMLDSSAPAEGLDRALAGLRLIGASTMLRQIEEASDESATVFLRHSPSHWSFGWRIDATRAVVAEARYHDARTMLCEIDTALVRLLCDTGMQAKHASLLPSRSAAVKQRAQTSPLVAAAIPPAAAQALARPLRSRIAAWLRGLHVAAAGRGGLARSVAQLGGRQTPGP